MTLDEVIDARFSVRAFHSRSVPEPLIRDLLSQASQAASGGNIQPWRIIVLSGAPLRALSRDVCAQLDAGHEERPENPVYPRHMDDPYRSRRRVCGFGLYSALGVARDDRERRRQQHRENFMLFGAPVGVFFLLDRSMGPAQWMDLGIFAQTLMLLTVQAGLGSCAQAAWAQWPATVRRHLDVGDSWTVCSGMAIGYPDESKPINQWRTERSSIGEFADIYGF